MRYRPLGRTGMKVSPLCLGTMMFGAWGNTDHGESIRIMHRALDAGINFIDTADVYSGGESEEIVGKALAGRRDDVVLATKVHFPMGDDPNRRGNSRRWIMRAVDESLRRLRHRLDRPLSDPPPRPDTDIDETLGALTDLVHQGKVRYDRLLDLPGRQIVEAQWVAERRGRERFVCEQPPYSILDRGIEADVLPACLRHGLGAIAVEPARGRLAERRDPDGGGPGRLAAASRFPFRYDMSTRNRGKLDAVNALVEVAETPGSRLIELALAFVVRHPG